MYTIIQRTEAIAFSSYTARKSYTLWVFLFAPNNYNATYRLKLLSTHYFLVTLFQLDLNKRKGRITDINDIMLGAFHSVVANADFQ